MTPAEKLALQYMPYTCPQLDGMTQDLLDQLPEKYSEDILKFVEDIKKQITCPMRTALEQACQVIIENERKNN